MAIHFEADRNLDVISMGRISVDFVPDTYGSTTANHRYTKFLGGSPANTAVAMARQGIRVGYIGKVGRDILGDYLVSYMAGKGIDISHIARSGEAGAQTALSVAELMAPNKKRSDLYRAEAADLYLSMEEIEEEYIARAKVLLISGASLSCGPAREAVFLAMEYARRNGVVVAFDPDYRPQSWRSRNETALYYLLALQKTDLLIATREEMSLAERLLLPENLDDECSAQFCFEQGASVVVIKHGEEGSYGFERGGSKHCQGLFPSRVISVQGAGDSYSGSLLARLIDGADLKTAMKYASASAALTVSGRSCSEHMPDRKMTEEFVALCEAGKGELWEFWE